MTTLEIIYTILLWIGYGAFSAYQITRDEFDNGNIYLGYVACIIFAPLILVFRMILGIIFLPES